MVRGEGEFALPELVDAIQTGTGFEKIQNLSHVDLQSRVVHNPERPKIADLDVNPIPDYGLIAGWKPGGVASIATSRGCPFSCTFCSVPGMYGHAFRTHSVDRVVEEVRIHNASDYIFFADDIFTANKKRVKELLSRMIQGGLTPLWGAQVRTEAVDDPELLRLMRDSNCFNVYVGFESVNPRTLKLFRKKQDLAKIERAIERFHDYRIGIHGMFVLGSDEDDLGTIEATTAFAKKHDIDSVQFMILTPVPGSPDWNSLYCGGDKYLINRNWSLYDGHHVVHQPRKIAPYELQMAAIKGMQKFYSWGGILKRYAKRDRYYATIRYWGKKTIHRWWKDEENRQYVQWLKDQLYSETKSVGRRGLRSVGVPELLLEERAGKFLQRFLNELDVKVVPLAEAAAEEVQSRWRRTVGCLITPSVKRAALEKMEFYGRLTAMTQTLQARWEKLPRVPFPLMDDHAPIFEHFAKIGLLFTRNLEKIRLAYERAGVQEGLWESA
ncbi:MAG: B12-binding domain-containing radical SAM protein [Candidatus Methylomirabilia bacterium]